MANGLFRIGLSIVATTVANHSISVTGKAVVRASLDNLRAIGSTPCHCERSEAISIPLRTAMEIAASLRS